MSHHIEINVSPGCHGEDDGVLIDGKPIDCRRVSLVAAVGELTVVILEIPAARVTVKGEADVVSQIPKGGT